MRQLAGREIGARIAQARQESGGMTQSELGDLLGVTLRSVQNYEAGETVPWRHFERLEQIFNRPLVWFLHGDSEAPTPEVLELLGELRDELRGRDEEFTRRLDQLRDQLSRLLAEVPTER